MNYPQHFIQDYLSIAIQLPEQYYLSFNVTELAVSNKRYYHCKYEVYLPFYRRVGDVYADTANKCLRTK